MNTKNIKQAILNNIIGDLFKLKNKNGFKQIKKCRNCAYLEDWHFDCHKCKWYNYSIEGEQKE